MRTVFVAALFALAASPGIAQTASGEIEKANQRFMDAFNSGDAATVGRLYTEQAVALPPEAEMIEGREAIQKFWQDAIDHGIRNLSLRSVRVDEYGGDTAREIGRFSLDAPASQDRTSKVDGKYVVVWRKSGGDWQLDSDIWNLTEPEPDVATGSSSSPAPTTPAGSGTASPPE